MNQLLSFLVKYLTPTGKHIKTHQRVPVRRLVTIVTNLQEPIEMLEMMATLVRTDTCCYFW